MMEDWTFSCVVGARCFLQVQRLLELLGGAVRRKVQDLGTRAQQQFSRVAAVVFHCNSNNVTPPLKVPPIVGSTTHRTHLVPYCVMHTLPYRFGLFFAHSALGPGSLFIKVITVSETDSVHNLPRTCFSRFSRLVLSCYSGAKLSVTHLKWSTK